MFFYNIHFCQEMCMNVKVKHKHYSKKKKRRQGLPSRFEAALKGKSLRKHKNIHGVIYLSQKRVH